MYPLVREPLGRESFLARSPAGIPSRAPFSRSHLSHVPTLPALAPSQQTCHNLSMDRLIILHPGALGDFLLALSIIQSVRAATNAAHTTAIASAPSARLAAGRGVIDAHVFPEDVALHTLFADTPPDNRLTTTLAGASHVLSFLSTPDHLIHDRLRRITGAHVISLDPRPTNDTLAARRHITAQWAAAIHAQNFSIPDPEPALLTLSARQGVDASPRWSSPALARRGSGGVATNTLSPSATPTTPRTHWPKRVLIHPGAGGLPKCWPLDRFLALADALQPTAIHWLLGPAELDCSPARFAPLRERTSARRETLSVENDLEAAARHMAAADLYIGNDAGTTHLAAALSVPTIAVFGPTDPAVWRPLGTIVRTVAPSAPASIDSVPLEPVLATVRSLIPIYA